ncbi:MAG: peptidoglycan-binding protein [Myxococcaceae bacterium]|nr:peptidoglycan-binding protein [Myxococcaceae bacterium]
MIHHATATRRPNPAPAATPRLERGTTGPDVARLQKLLNQRGADLTPDGLFGPLTDAAVRRFQSSHGLNDDGIVGPKTWAALRGHAPKPPPGKPGPVSGPGPSNGHSAEWNKYADMIRKAGGTVNPGGKPTVLGIRAKGGGASTSYQDKFVVLRPNGDVVHIRGSTRPGQTRSSLSPDVNGDGVGDVAMLRPGNYDVVANGPHDGAPSFHVLTKGGSDRVAAWRDLNHDGFYSSSERRWSERHGVTAGAILFHTGFANPSSIGCQNIKPSDMGSFVRAVGGAGGNFNFTLVEV